MTIITSKVLTRWQEPNGRRHEIVKQGHVFAHRSSDSYYVITAEQAAYEVAEHGKASSR